PMESRDEAASFHRTWKTPARIRRRFPQLPQPLPLEKESQTTTRTDRGRITLSAELDGHNYLGEAQRAELHGIQMESWGPFACPLAVAGGLEPPTTGLTIRGFRSRPRQTVPDQRFTRDLDRSGAGGRNHLREK
ncbi:MAG TPA: hypothetical protein VHT23_10370, partial [Gemmatimonadaceae bacterium]|nr:hypothetical protein [Gemmatimonadaceae bacterium]